jgi:hypothetical protein
VVVLCISCIQGQDGHDGGRVEEGIVDAVLKALNLTSPKGGDTPRVFREKPRHAKKPVKHAGSPNGGTPRVIHQPC